MTYPQSTWLTDLRETAQDLRQDLVLLEAMALRLEQPEGLTRVSREELFQSLWRAVDYLSQHTMELARLEALIAPPTPPG